MIYLGLCDITWFFWVLHQQKFGPALISSERSGQLGERFAAGFIRPLNLICWLRPARLTPVKSHKLQFIFCRPQSSNRRQDPKARDLQDGCERRRRSNECREQNVVRIYQSPPNGNILTLHVWTDVGENCANLRHLQMCAHSEHRELRCLSVLSIQLAGGRPFETHHGARCSRQLSSWSVE